MFPRHAKYAIPLAAAALFLAAAGGTLWYQEQPHCPVTREAAVVSGASLEPLVQPGTKLTLLRGYYACHQIQRNDLVVFNYSASKEPLVKIARGIPGDTLALSDQGNGTWHILVNGAELRNSAGEPYQVNEYQEYLLSLYIKDYGGRIPADAYLALGDLAAGSRDSRDFGLVNIADVIGKAQ